MDSAGETPLDEEKASAAAEALQSFLGTDHLVQAVEALDAPTPAPTCADPVWDQLNGVLNAPTCRKCMMPCALDKLVNKSKGEQRVHVVCRSCNSTTTMLSRHLGQWPIAGFPRSTSSILETMSLHHSAARTPGLWFYQSLPGGFSC